MVCIMRLNIEKIKMELSRIDKNQVWLAEKMSCKKQWVNYLLKSNGQGVTLKTIERVAEALAISPKDLII